MAALIQKDTRLTLQCVAHTDHSLHAGRIAVEARAHRLLALAPQGGRCPCLGGVGHWIRGLQEREEALLLVVPIGLGLSAAGVLARCVAGRR